MKKVSTIIGLVASVIAIMTFAFGGVTFEDFKNSICNCNAIKDEAVSSYQKVITEQNQRIQELEQEIYNYQNEYSAVGSIQGEFGVQGLGKKKYAQLVDSIQNALVDSIFFVQAQRSELGDVPKLDRVEIAPMGLNLSSDLLKMENFLNNQKIAKLQRRLDLIYERTRKVNYKIQNRVDLEVQEVYDKYPNDLILTLIHVRGSRVRVRVVCDNKDSSEESFELGEYLICGRTRIRIKSVGHGTAEFIIEEET